MTQLYTLSKPKRNDFRGTTKQVFEPSIYQTTLDRIKQGIVVAIAFCDHLGNLCYLIAPQIWHNIDGDPTKIIGNASNPIGEYCAISIEVKDALRYFPTLAIASNIPNEFKGPHPVAKKDLEDSSLADAEDGTVVAAPIPKVLPIFAGQPLVTGSVLDNAVLEKILEALGEAGLAWASQMSQIYRNSDDARKDAAIVKDKLMTTDARSRKFVHAEFGVTRGVDFTSPSVAFQLALSGDDYPELVEKLKSIFMPPPPAPVQQQASAALDVISLKTALAKSDPAVQREEHATKASVAKLRLLFGGGKMCPTSGKISEFKLATLSKSFRKVLEDPKGPTQVSALVSLLETTFTMGAKNDNMSVLAQNTIHVVQNSLASLLLAGEFGTAPVLYRDLESKKLTLEAFLPQMPGDACLDQIRSHEQTARNEVLCGVHASQQSRPKSNIKNVGRLENVKDVVSGLINVNALVAGVCDLEEMLKDGGYPPLVQQMYIARIKFYQKQDTQNWLTLNNTQQPYHHLCFFGDNDNIFVKMSLFATGFLNVNAAQLDEDAADWDMEHADAAGSIHTSTLNHTQILVHRGAPDFTRPTLASSSNNGGGGGGGGGGTGRGGGGGTGRGGPTPAAPDAKSNRSKREDRDNATGNLTKRERADSTASKGKSEDKDKGWIILGNPNMPRDEIFPIFQSGKSVCADFVCQGRACEYAPNKCPHGNHAFRPKLLDRGDVHGIVMHLNSKKHGWLNKNSFNDCEYKFSPDHEHLLGNKAGPAKRT
jgi:uncharacterized membrane protein YgcG